MAYETGLMVLNQQKKGLAQLARAYLDARKDGVSDWEWLYLIGMGTNYGLQTAIMIKGMPEEALQEILTVSLDGIIVMPPMVVNGLGVQGITR